MICPLRTDITADEKTQFWIIRKLYHNLADFNVEPKPRQISTTVFSRNKNKAYLGRYIAAGVMTKHW
jgi:hypothetical protein